MQQRRPIRRLPPLLVSQIAAGEVVERPASVVKELVENAIDAGATRIEVSIEGGGIDVIRVVDDGGGIPADELPLAVAAHATSKIAEASDLEAIRTMGFRGEALASIASVARLSILSRTQGSDAAHELVAEGDLIDGPRPASGPRGTTVTVRGLFAAVPARRKFLKSEGAEAGRVAEGIEAIALAHPQIRFLLRSGAGAGRALVDLGATEDPRRRALDVIGREHESKLLLVDASDGGATLWGLIGLPETARSTARHLRVQLNGRPIADRSIVHAVREAYRGLVEPGRSPMAILHLDLDPREVDVNVHPAKSEVRFRHPSAIHQLVYRALRRVLAGADLVPSFPLPEPGGSLDVEIIREGSRGALHAPAAFARSISGSAPHRPIHLDAMHSALGPPPPLPARAPIATEAPHESLPTMVRAVEILQIHAAFVVAHDREGLLIVDQHALHERVMFERLLERLRQGDLERQQLLVPVQVEVGPREVEAIEELAPLFRRIGLEVEPAGPRVVAIRAFPSFLFERGVEPAEFLRSLLEKASDGAFGRGDAFEASLSEVLDLMACKAAVKAGDRLSAEELADLLRQRERIERSSNCPHGRPTSLRITIRELERRFGRS